MNRVEGGLLLALACLLPPAWGEEAKKGPVEITPAMELLELLGEERPADDIIGSDPLRWLEGLMRDSEAPTKESKHD